MNKDKFKSVAISLDCYKKLQELSLNRFEMPISMASVVCFFINKAYASFIKSVQTAEETLNEKYAEKCWELIKDWEPSTN
tara:strand:+ start:134 stop:373 length:240 start_codon:yes stop_codon:yes gene_type:complete